MKLPSAPLSEVVFELRWALEGAADTPIQFQQDPLYPQLASDFTAKAKSQGFIVRKELQSGPAGPLGHNVHYRFCKSEEKLFPLWQIGPGLFACNESTDYEWSDFKSSLKNGLQALLSSYPKVKSFPMRPIHLELRYIDGFSSDLLGHNDLIEFLGKDVNFSLEVNDFMKSKPFSGETKGHIELIREVKGKKDTVFAVNIATASQAKPAIIQMTSKVLKKSDFIDLGDNNRTFVANVLRWAEDAHELTHDFFQSFVSKPLMSKFKE